MEYMYPDYYEQFTCIANRCDDTCCSGWQIVIDEASLKRYEKVEGPFGNRLHNCIDHKEGVFCQNGPRCAFLNDQNLCDLYAELGEEALCHTCKNYPRHIEEYEGLNEVHLSLSCPEACRIILSNKDKVTYEYKETEEEAEMYEDFDFLFHSKLEDTRDFLCQILQNRSLTIKQRMGIILVFAHDMQRRIQRNEIFEIDDLMDRYSREDAIPHFLSQFKQYEWNFSEKYEWFCQAMKEYKDLEPLTEDWFTFLDCSTMMLGRLSNADYWQLKSEFRFSISTHDVEIEQILVNLLYTYFCGAVYDYDVLSKVKFIIIAASLICELNFIKWYTEDRSLSMKERVWITHWYSREIEHSDKNLNMLTKKLKSNPLFNYKTLLSMIIS